ncbi:hypothetical protein SUNI508_07710 [Seiridium unicorne]|uniref:Uncharacterized protein n=1 Tax=Seiridium unicorne TaxID=138068 RepID=A0ABR2UVK0_9PEZI
MVPVASHISQLKWRHDIPQPRPLSHLQLFADASRGPRGAFMMLFNVRTRAFTAWSLACVTLTPLKIGQAAQQVLALGPSRHSYERGLSIARSKPWVSSQGLHPNVERPVLKINNTAYAPELSPDLLLLLSDAQAFPFETPPYHTIEDTATAT